MPAERTILSLLSPEYMYQPSCSCLRLLRQLMPCALVLALARAGKSIAARMAIMAMTTRSSISVKPNSLQATVVERPALAWAFDLRFIKFLALRPDASPTPASGAQVPSPLPGQYGVESLRGSSR